MVRLNEDEFVRRCLLTENIDPERARLLYFKLWSLHIDSRALLNRTGGSVEKSEAVLKQKTNGNRKRVIKPGMFFRVKAADTEENLEVVMVMGLVANNDKGKWTCAAVYLTDASSGSHELFVAKQVVLTSAMLTEELPLVYDSTTRYYKVADAQ
jgi:kinesin family protein 2/24